MDKQLTNYRNISFIFTSLGVAISMFLQDNSIIIKSLMVFVIVNSITILAFKYDTEKEKEHEEKLKVVKRQNEEEIDELKERHSRELLEYEQLLKEKSERAKDRPDGRLSDFEDDNE